MQVRFQHLFVVDGKERHGSEDKFEQFEIQIRLLKICPGIGSDIFHSLEKILNKYRGKDRRSR